MNSSMGRRWFTLETVVFVRPRGWRAAGNYYGVVGTKAGVERLERWLKSLAGFIDVPPPRKGTRPIEPQHVAFPGFSAAYNAQWPVKPKTVIDTIDPSALHDALCIVNRNEAIKAAVDLYVNALIARCDRMEDPPSFWFVVIS